MIFINILLQICYCTVVGIDLGSDSIKVAVGSRYKPVHLVRNLFSNQGTPNVFIYRDKSNWAFGEEAAFQCRANSSNCIQNQRIPLNNNFYFPGNALKGYQIAALSLLKVIHDVNISENIVDEMKVVIAIPPSMSNREKSYLYSALQIAGINCIQFVTSSYAPIEVYVNERKSESSYDNTAVIIDIGHEGVRVSGFEYGYSKIVQKFCQYNDAVGGKTIDNNLLNYVINKYQIKFTTGYYNDYEYQKNRLLLLSEIRKAREQLSVTAKVTFEFKSQAITLTRQNVNDCSHEVKKVLNQVIQSLKQNHRDLLKSGSVQLIGGCSRIIGLQDYIQELLPSIRVLRSMDSISSVCMGACYVIDSEVQSSIQVHDALVTTEVILKTSGNIYKLFSYGNTENFGPVVRLNNVDPNHLFTIIDKNDNENEFTKFRINVPSNNYNSYYNTVDLGFSLNYYLMPVPDQPMLVQQYEDQIPLSINYEKIGWEIPSDQLTRSKIVIESMMSGISKKQKIEEYKSSIQNMLNNYGSDDWRNKAFPGIYAYINNLYNSCVNQLGDQCNEKKIDQILKDFKSLVHFILKIDNRSERNQAIEELYNLLHACKNSGAKYNDVENWINSKLYTASLNEIYEQIGILKERGKKSHQSYFKDL